MKKNFLMFALIGVASLALMSADAFAQNNPMVGGAAMYRSKSIVENALNSPIHTTLVSAVKAAGLVETLSGKGPFTVFAPTNDAFAKVPSDALNSLMQPENKAMLTKILTYHVVPGKMSAADLAAKVKSGNGKTTLKTFQGDTLTVTDAGGGKLQVVDAKGNKATVTTADVNQKNGVIHVVDTVLLPS